MAEAYKSIIVAALYWGSSFEVAAEAMGIW